MKSVSEGTSEVNMLTRYNIGTNIHIQINTADSKLPFSVYRLRGCEGKSRRASLCEMDMAAGLYRPFAVLDFCITTQLDLNIPGTHNSHQTVNVDIADQI